MIAAAWAWLSGSAIGRLVLAGLALVGTVLAAWGIGKREGRIGAQQQQEAADHEAYQDAVETRQSVEDRIRRAGDGTSAGRLHTDWSRD